VRNRGIASRYFIGPQWGENQIREAPSCSVVPMDLAQAGESDRVGSLDQAGWVSLQSLVGWGFAGKVEKKTGKIRTWHGGCFFGVEPVIKSFVLSRL
jgi:hypothetical protein